MTDIDRRTALIVIDAPVGIDDARHGHRNNPGAETHIAQLLKAWRKAGRPVIHIRHDSTTPGSALTPGEPGHAIKPEAAPATNEPVFGKSVNSAFIGTGLDQYLRKRGITSLVLVGFTTDHCVSTTARMGANLGYEVTLVSDATATHERTSPDGQHFCAMTMHETTLASLCGEFVRVVTTGALLARDAGLATG